MKLPVPGTLYDGRNEAGARLAIEIADAGNAKLGTDNHLLGWQFYTAESSITAHAGGTKAAAYVLTKAISHVGTCATAADSLLLMPAKAGKVAAIINRGAQAAQVFGQGTDTINDVATATGLSQASNTAAVYFCPVDGAWYRVLSA